jgi:hypothetical protein
VQRAHLRGEPRGYQDLAGRGIHPEQSVDQKEQVSDRVEVTSVDKPVTGIRITMCGDKANRKHDLGSMKDRTVEQRRIPKLGFEIVKQSLAHNLAKEPVLNVARGFELVRKVRLSCRTREQEVQEAEEVEALMPVQPRRQGGQLVVLDHATRVKLLR